MKEASRIAATKAALTLLIVATMTGAAASPAIGGYSINDFDRLSRDFFIAVDQGNVPALRRAVLAFVLQGERV